METDDGLHDRELQAWEAQLAGLVPRLPAQRHNELLYQCGYAAGRRAAATNLRVWKSLAAGLLICLAGLSVPLVQNRHANVAAGPLPAPSRQPDQPQRPSPAVSGEETLIARGLISTPLDAWQLPDSGLQILEQEIERHRKADPHTRSLAVANLSRTLFNP